MSVKTHRTIIKTLLLAMLLGSGGLLAQDKDTDDTLDLPAPVKKKHVLLTGFYVGSYFANRYSASAYSGYGFDVDGHPNQFLNSLMYQKIINEYGGGYGQTDYIAQAIGVDPHQWSFTESDMPINMHYIPAILVGFNFKVPVDHKNAVIVNVNGTKLEIDGNFTISSMMPQSTPTNPAVNSNVKTFTIIGKEQRMQFQLGYQRILGDDEKLNFFVEGGIIGTLAKFDRNTIYINTLQIDLTNYVNQTLYPSASGPFKRPVGFGIGCFGGAGLDIEANPKITVQILYTLAGEKIHNGTVPELKPQHSIGLRAYYNF